jgi:hypothetical protein
MKNFLQSINYIFIFHLRSSPFTLGKVHSRLRRVIGAADCWEWDMAVFGLENKKNSHITDFDIRLLSKHDIYSMHVV